MPKGHTCRGHSGGYKTRISTVGSPPRDKMVDIVFLERADSYRLNFLVRFLTIGTCFFAATILCVASSVFRFGFSTAVRLDRAFGRAYLAFGVVSSVEGVAGRGLALVVNLVFEIVLANLAIV
jgi:hypothetical protein